MRDKRAEADAANALTIAEAGSGDLEQLLRLYTQLHDNPLPAIDDALARLWSEILADKNHFVLVGKIADTIVSSCVLLIVPNLTHGQRPYALIENVVTDERSRGKGYATQLLDAAKALVVKNNCYKLMLMTGSKQPATLDFYRKAGYNSQDKTAFVQWL